MLPGFIAAVIVGLIGDRAGDLDWASAASARWANVAT